MKAFFRTLLAVIVGMFLTFILAIFIIFAIAAGNKKTIEIKNNSVLLLKLDKRIPEKPVDNPLKNIPFVGDDIHVPVSLKHLIDDIRAASNDDKIKGIYLQTEASLQASFATLEEIRNALIDFKKSGKFIYAYSETYVNKNYYLASVADSVFVNPNGLFVFNGLHSEQMFLKGTFEKLEIKPNLFRAGKYKAAGESFTKDALSAENREQLTSFLNSIYDDFLKKVADSRKIDSSQLRKIANELLIKFPSDAVKYKLADKVVYESDVLNTLKKKLDVTDSKDLSMVEIDDYDQVTSDKVDGTVKDGKIALIYAAGEIVSGEGDEDQVGSVKLAEAIRKAREDKKIKAIVLRVNSPGGSALASDIIWKEVELAKKAKPVIASFGDLAASGGYYIAAPADVIFAQANTITGSIGVWGIVPTIEAFWKNKLGITWDRVITAKYADIANPNRELTSEERMIIQTYIDSTYHTFKERVASGRKLDTAYVSAIAQGRVYSGTQAIGNKLVDKIGNLDDAISFAASKAGLKNYSIKVMPTYKSNWKKVFMNMDEVKENLLKSELQENYDLYKKISRLKDYQGIMMYYPFDIEIN